MCGVAEAAAFSHIGSAHHICCLDWVQDKDRKTG